MNFRDSTDILLDINMKILIYYIHVLYNYNIIYPFMHIILLNNRTSSWYIYIVIYVYCVCEKNILQMSDTKMNMLKVAE